MAQERGIAMNIRRYLEEGKRYIDKGDPVQASEKLYKASEEAVKELARKFDLPEYKEAEEKGRWTTPLLFSAVRSLRKKVNPDIIHWWAQAWVLHVEGFHEARLNIEEVKARVEFVEKLVELSKSWNKHASTRV
jgi:hypothetical protein